MSPVTLQEPPESGQIRILGFDKTLTEWIILLLGPIFYLTILALPIGDSVTARGGLAIIAWAAWYWGTGVVGTGYTIFIPLLGTAFLPGMDWGQITKTVIHPGLGMLLGPALIVCMWSRWGLTRRMALYALSKVGTSVRKQATMWVMLATSVSFVAANTVIAIALTPIALEILKECGYNNAKKLREGKSSMLIIIAIGIGASLGGFLTPMAGGQAVITWQQLSDTLGYYVPMISFTSLIALPVFLSMIPVALLFRYAFPVDSEHLEGSVEYFDKELAKMGSMSKSEKLGLVLFFFAILLPFLQPFWAPLLPKGMNLSPSLIFTVITCILAIIPAPDQGAPNGKWKEYEPGERLLSMNAIRVLPIQAFMLWPTAMSIAVLVNMTGASKLMSSFLGNYWDLPAYTGTGLFALFCVALAQPASDAGAAGMLAPVIATATAQAGQNPIPWLMMMGYTVNFSFMVPTATGTMALPIALDGKTSWRLPLYGLCCAIVTGLVSWGFWGTVFAYDLQYFQNFIKF